MPNENANYNPKDVIEALASGIASKQPKLIGQAGQLVGFDTTGIAIPVRGWNNHNFLINSDFTNPVNRNGQMKYSAAGCTIDQWNMIIDIGRIEVTDDGLLLDASTNAITLCQTCLPYLSKLLAGKTVTISILYESITALTNGTGIMTHSSGAAVGSKLRNNLNLTCPAGEVNCRSKTFVYDTDITQPMWIYIKNGEKAKIKAVKIELGSRQTLAHQDDDGNWVLNDPPNYELQYALCSLYSPSTGEWIGSQHSNPNLLINWYFADPINQQGQTEYTGISHGIDRWRVYANTSIQLEDKYVHMTIDGLGGGMDQRIELPSQLSGKIVTVSILYRCFSGAARWYFNFSQGPVYHGINLIPDGEWHLGSVTFEFPNITDDSKYTQIATYNYSNSVASIDFAATKFELGTTQTLAHISNAASGSGEYGSWVLNDPPPDKDLTLSKCRRYLYRIDKRVDWNSTFGYGYVWVSNESTSSLVLMINLPEPTRILPTVVLSSDATFHLRVHGLAINDEDLVNTIEPIKLLGRTLLCRVKVNHGGLQPYHACWLNLASGYVDIDARL